ncbi:radical SAM protein [Nanoarchaeota archaeon]
MANADIKLGYTCNNNCIHCVIADQRAECIKNKIPVDVNTEEYKKELITAKQQGYSSVVFTGGEPTIRKDILELLNFADKLGLSIGMQTNGRMFYYEDFTKEVAKIPRINFVVAVHGPNEEIHDSITQVKGSFNQTINGISNLIKFNKKVLGKIVISKLNGIYLKDIAILLNKMGVKELFYAFPHAQGNARKYFDKVVPKYSDIMSHIYETIDYCKANKMEINFEAVPPCLMEGYEDYIGIMKHFETKTKLKQVGSMDVDWDTKRKEIQSKFKQCKLCKHNKLCEGVWEEYPEKYGSNEFKPVK